MTWLLRLLQLITASWRSPAIMTNQAREGHEDRAVKLLVFDMGHVFVDFEWDTVCQGFCQAAGVSYEELKQAFKEVAQLGYESGRIDTAGFLRELNARLGANIGRDEFDLLWTSTFRENPEMAALLGTLRAQRPLYLLSNTNEVHYDYLHRTFNVGRHFDQQILSYKVLCSKPDPAIYAKVLELSGLEAKDCLFVDDLLPNGMAAEQLGMRYIQFKGVDDLKNRLKTEYGFAV